ncbi:hypothetical protein [uncultured Jatrophihabitans sp.]|uniref:hypothetical protein n=1 Tax=uncultured Jatrophihabitans sp. TaxID=1610747 RepID=UPI0035C9E392
MAADRLTAVLGGPPAAALAALPAADQDAFAELVADARARQASALEAAFAQTLKHVPFPLRKIVQKVLLG